MVIKKQTKDIKKEKEKRIRKKQTATLISPSSLSLKTTLSLFD